MPRNNRISSYGWPNDGSPAFGPDDDIVELFHAMQVRKYEQTFGVPLAFLQEHLELVEHYFRDSDPENRCVALSFFGEFELDPRRRERLFQSLRSDPASAVRRTAAGIIGRLYVRDGDLGLLSVLKKTAQDARECDEVRRSAYLAVTVFDREDNLIDTTNFRFPEDTDWEYFDAVIPPHE